ncbi:MAG: hypothetical protein WCP29_00930 [Acidobacteriota bacterium]
MKSVWDPDVRKDLKERLARLTPETSPSWGTMTAGRMVVHVSDSFKTSIGELAIEPLGGPLKFTPLKQLILYVIPLPRNLPTAPELLARAPGDWSADTGELAGLIDQFAIRDRARPWPDHGLFGHMTGEEWGVLMYRHTEHHFRQFGI